MNSQKQLVSLSCLCLLLLVLSVTGLMGLQPEASRQLNHYPSQKLFVFGGSYTDTGNTDTDTSNSWKEPYGITFPKKPTGRFSDGRVLTDYIAKCMGLKSPIPYNFRNEVDKEYLKYGMNFAVGGAGVFDTFSPGPTITAQTHSFEQLIKENMYTPIDLINSVALVAVGGNDYNYYLQTNGSFLGFPSFIALVVKEITTYLIRLQSLGVKNIAVGNLQPIGCLSRATGENNFQRCNSTLNNFTAFHNDLLKQSVTKLNQETKDHSTIVILDINDSFMSVLNDPSSHNIKERFKPCCIGVSEEYYCGDIDENNVKKYTICENINSTFFWDFAHPTQAGWNAVYNELQVRASSSSTASKLEKYDGGSLVRCF